MAFNIFLDINIVADLLDNKRLWHKEASALFAAAEKEDINCYVSESVLNTTAYIVSKNLPVTTTVSIFSYLLSFIKVLPISNKIYIEALQNVKNDIEDSVLYQIALSEKMDYFITNDLKDFKKIENSSLPVIQAKQLLELL